MKILRLTSENVKRLSVVEIEPDGSLVIVGGQNGAGKSSVLDSIMMCLAGGKSIPPKPIRRGQKKARVELDLGDIVVERTFSDSGSKVTVRNKDGASFPSPQSMLDSLCSRLSFDPLEFSRLKPDDQVDALKQLVGLDFRAEDAEAKKVYDQRTLVNRDLKQTQAQLANLPNDPTAPVEEVSLADLSEELQAADQVNRDNEQARQNLASIERDIDAGKRKIDEIESQIKALTQKRDEIKAKVQVLVDERESAEEEVKSLMNIDTGELKQRMRTVEADNERYRKQKRRLSLRGRCDELEAESESLTSRLDAIEQSKADAMSAAKFPVDGLGFDQHGITYSGLPFEQCSSAERLRVSVAMGAALNPKLRVMLVRDGSLLDDTSLALMSELATKHDCQVWLERVGDKGPVTVVIEDGHVREESVEIES